MGWGWLKPIAKIGAVAAAPFTGGASLSAMPLLDAAGNMLSEGAQASAANRGSQIDTLMDQERLRMGARTEDRANRGDLWRQMQQAAYVGSGGQGYAAPTIVGRTGLKSLPQFGFGPRGSTDAEMRGAAGLSSEALGRLEGGPREEFTIDPKLMKGSIWEKLAGFGGAALSAYAASRR
jgi:hypothetical protein